MIKFFYCSSKESHNHFGRLEGVEGPIYVRFGHAIPGTMVELVVFVGTLVDSVSLAFIGEIFPWRKPTLVTHYLPTQHMFLKLWCSMLSMVTN